MRIIWEQSLRNCIIKKAKWRPCGRNSLTWAFFYVNDQLEVDVSIPQLMHCMLCCETPINLAIFGQKTNVKKGLVSYLKNNGITTLKTHVNANHSLIARRFGVNNIIKNLIERQPAKIKVYNQWE